MRQVAVRPLRLSGWVFPLPALNRQSFPFIKRWLSVLFLLVLIVVQPTVLSGVFAQHSSSDRNISSEATAVYEQQHADPSSIWEGSAQGVGYSKFNHRFAGLCILLIGISELGCALRTNSALWTRLLLSNAFGAVGIFLLVWSDHEAWPIGSLSFTQTFFGHDHEILQHKFYGVAATTVALSELLRRIRWAVHPAWEAPLPLFAVIGGLMLFVHSHGIHPAAEKIEFHHALMGAVAVSAGVSKSVAAWMTSLSKRSVRKWELVWVGHIFLIGIQLIVFFE